MLCKNCGNQLPDNANFCDQCGTKTFKANVFAPNNRNNIHNQSIVQSNNQNNNGGCLKSCLKGLGILFIVLMIGSCMGGNDNKDISDTSKSSQKVENKVDNEKTVEKKPEDVKQEKAVESSAPLPVQTQVKQQQQAVNDQRSFVANAKTGKIHVSTCRSVSRMKEANKVYITGSAAAEASGYSPCANCRPF